MSKPKTLLDKALSIEVNRRRDFRPSDEVLSLALGYVTNTVTVSQIAKVLNCSTENVYSKLGRALMAGARTGLIKISKVKP